MKKQEAWIAAHPGETALTLGLGVHYSSKPVNTNAIAAGVRLAADDNPETHLVGYATLKVNRRSTTYIEGAGSARPFNQASAVIEGTVDDLFTGCSHEQRAMVHSESAVLDSGALVGAREVDIRLRQLIISLPGGADFVITPLHSPIFSREMTSRLFMLAEKEPERHIQKVAVLNIGGQNPQNAGRLIRSMTRPLVFDAPTEDFSLRRAMAINRRGLSVRSLLPVGQLEELRLWRTENRDANGVLDSRSGKRKAEASMICAIACRVLRNAQAIQVELARHELEIPDEGNGLPLHVAGILNPRLRDRAWASAFANEVLREIEDYRRNMQTASLGEFGDLQGLLDEVTHAVMSV